MLQQRITSPSVHLLVCLLIFFLSSPKDIFSPSLLEKEEGRERDINVRNMDQLPLVGTLPSDQTCTWGMCPNWESNPQPFYYRTTLQPTELHWPGPSMVSFIFFILLFFKDFMCFTFREVGWGWEREGEKHVKDTSFGWLSHAPYWRSWPATQACALTGNRTSDLLIHRLVLKPLSHTSQGYDIF